MLPLYRAAAVLLLASSCSWAGGPASGPQASPEAAQALWDKAAAAFEKAAPIAAAAPAKELEALSRAELPQDLAEKAKALPALVAKVRALQAARAPKPPACPRLRDRGADASACVLEAVREAAAGFAIADAGRVDQIGALYLVRFNAPKDQSPEEAARAQQRLAKIFADPKVPAGARMRMQGVMRSAAAFRDAGASLDVGGGPGGVAAGGSRRTLDQVLREARAGGAAGPGVVRPGVVPDLKTPGAPASAASAPGLLDQAASWADGKRRAAADWFKGHARNLNGWADEQTDENGVAGFEKFAKKGAALAAGVAGHVIDNAPKWAGDAAEFAREVSPLPPPGKPFTLAGYIADKKAAAAAVGGAVVHIGRGILDSAGGVGEAWAAFNTDKTTTYQGLVATAKTVGFLGTFVVPAEGAAAATGAREVVASAGARAVNESAAVVSAAARRETVAAAASVRARPVRIAAVRDEGRVGAAADDLDFTSAAPKPAAAPAGVPPSLDSIRAVTVPGPELDKLTAAHRLVTSGEKAPVADLAEAEMRLARFRENSPLGGAIYDDQAAAGAYRATRSEEEIFKTQHLSDVEETVATRGRHATAKQKGNTCTAHATCNLLADDIEAGKLSSQDVVKRALEINPDIVKGGLKTSDVPTLVSDLAARADKVVVKVDAPDMVRWMSETGQPMLVNIRTGSGLDGVGGHALVVGNPFTVVDAAGRRTVKFKTYDSNLPTGENGYIAADTLASLMRGDAIGVIPKGAEAGPYARLYESSKLDVASRP